MFKPSVKFNFFRKFHFIYLNQFFISAIGQIMLYVDGMNGVIEHNETIQWLYSLLSSKVHLL